MDINFKFSGSAKGGKDVLNLIGLEIWIQRKLQKDQISLQPMLMLLTIARGMAIKMKRDLTFQDPNTLETRLFDQFIPLDLGALMDRALDPRGEGIRGRDFYSYTGKTVYDTDRVRLPQEHEPKQVAETRYIYQLRGPSGDDDEYLPIYVIMREDSVQIEVVARDMAERSKITESLEWGLAETIGVKYQKSEPIGTHPDLCETEFLDEVEGRARASYTIDLNEGRILEHRFDIILGLRNCVEEVPKYNVFVRKTDAND